MCCGQKRAALRNNPPPAARTSNPDAAPSGPQSVRPVPSAGTTKPAPPGHVILHYVGDAPLSVRGPVSGRVYNFSSASQTKAVDGRDAIILLRILSLRRVVP